MRGLSYKTVLVAFGLIGCFHHSREERVLAAFSGRGGDWLFSGEAAPQYLAFRDDRSERVFSEVMRSGMYRLAPIGGPLFCPGVPENGNHGYLLGARVDTVMGDSAFVSVSRICTQFARKCPSGQACISWGGAIEYSTNYLVARRNGVWKVVKPLSGSAAIMM